MKFSTMLTMGRVSNLPTIWTNTAVGLALAGFLGDYSLAVSAMIAMSFIYIGGMFFNDVFDAKWDSTHNPSRPIPQKESTIKEATSLACLFFLAALIMLFAVARSGQMVSTGLSAAGLITCILVYNWKHKTWRYSSWIMGACRFLVYLTAANILADTRWPTAIFGASLMAYIAGITYLAKSEHLNQLKNSSSIALLYCPAASAMYFSYIASGFSFILMATILASVFWTLFAIRSLMPGENRNISKAVSQLLAGICLVDAAFLFLLDQIVLGRFALVAFLLCLILQRKFKAS